MGGLEFKKPHTIKLYVGKKQIVTVMHSSQVMAYNEIQVNTPDQHAQKPEWMYTDKYVWSSGRILYQASLCRLKSPDCIGAELKVL